MNYRFEWDAVKAVKNLKKHGVSFEEATEVFMDPLQLSLLDDVGDYEERWITLGNSKAHRLCLVVHTFVSYQDAQVNIRVISARQATKHEQQQYKEL